MFRYVGGIFFVLFQIASQGATQTGLPFNWERTVVVIEKFIADTSGTFTIPHGTGFFVYDDSQKNRVFLVTNKHILRGRDSVLIRYYDKDKLTDFVLQLKDRAGNLMWKGHLNPVVDVAAIILQKNAMVAVWELPRFRFLADVGLGEDVFFFGFPLGVTSLAGRLGDPILRHGITSYKTYGATFIGADTIPTDVVLIDGFSFGGNSGSPVLTRATMDSKAKLVGIVYGHVPFVEEAVDLIRQKPVGLGVNVNTGLVKAFPSDRIKETVEQFRSL